MYDGALFVHILGVALLVLGLCYSLGGLALAQRARDVEGVRRALTFVPVAEKVIPVAMLLIPIAGLYMASKHGDDGEIAWSSGWLEVSLAVFGVMLVLGPAVEGARIGALHKALEATADGPIPADVRDRLTDPVLSHVAAFGGSQIVAFLWLMTNKPGLGGAILTVAIAAAVSVPVARLMLRNAANARPAVQVPAQGGAPATAADAPTGS